MSVKTIKQILYEMPQLPAMPNVVSQALNIIRDPDSSISRLASIISKDSALTSQILKMVNSAYYGFSSQITTIDRALALLGLEKVKSMILSVAVRPMMLTQNGKELWIHSLRCAVGSEMIAKKLGYKDADEAFVVGLLHDIGKIVLEVYNTAAFNEVQKLFLRGADRLSAEKMMFGFDHTEIGEELVAIWNLPLIISNCIRHHHSPQNSEIKFLASVVYVADRVTKEPIKYPVLEPDIIETFDFDIPDPLQLREEIFEKSEAIIKAFT